MNTPVQRTLASAAILVCFFIDRALKSLAVTYADVTLQLLPPHVSWELFYNPGIAFSIPVPAWLQLALTPLILYGVWQYALGVSSARMRMAAALITAGAVSNALDRVSGATIDYLRIGTAHVNLADGLVVAGLILLLLHRSGGKKHDSGVEVV